VTVSPVPISPSTGGYERGQISHLHFFVSSGDYSLFCAAEIPEETMPPAAPLNSPVASSNPFFFLYNNEDMHEIWHFTSVQRCEVGEQHVFSKMIRKQAECTKGQET
jgi:hypothetical protein